MKLGIHFMNFTHPDGAAAVIVASERRAKELGLEILAEIVDWGYWGNDPAYMGIAPVFATANALERAGIGFDQRDEVPEGARRQGAAGLSLQQPPARPQDPSRVLGQACA